MPSAATKSQWGCHFMIFSGHLPCAQQLVGNLSIRAPSLNGLIVPVRSMSFFPSFAKTPLKNPSTNFNTNLTTRAYDTFSQQDANCNKYIDATFISSHLAERCLKLSNPTCRESSGSAAVLCAIRWHETACHGYHGSLVGLNLCPAGLNPHL